MTTQLRADFPVLVPGFDSIQQLHIELIKRSIEQLRQTIGLTDNQKPCPRVITHMHYHLDEIWATLLFRAIHRTDDDMEHLIELIQRDRALSFILHPEIQNAVLFGIGGNSRDATDAMKANVVIYDEHSSGGRRLAESASRILIENIIRESASKLSVVEPIIKEIDNIDQYGDKAGGEAHIGRLIKSLHWTNTCNENSLDRISSGQKEAVICASLAAVTAIVPELVQQQPNNDMVMASWDRYQVKNQHVFSSNTALQYIKERILQQSATNTTLLQLRNIAYALDQTWESELADYVLHTWFECWVQLQYDFENCQIDDHHIQQFTRGKLVVEWFQRRYEDKVPHRPRLYLANQNKRPTILVVYDPYVMITAIFPSNYLSKDVWEKFADALEKKEPGLWYRQMDPESKRTAFILNGTHAHQEMPPSQIRPTEFIHLVPHLPSN